MIILLVFILLFMIARNDILVFFRKNYTTLFAILSNPVELVIESRLLNYFINFLFCGSIISSGL